MEIYFVIQLTKRLHLIKNIKTRIVTLLDKSESLGMRITIGSRFSVDNISLPLIDSVLDDEIASFVYPFTR